jgi:hypothetical protein
MPALRFDSEQQYRAFLDAYHSPAKTKQDGQGGAIPAQVSQTPTGGGKRASIRPCATEDEEQITFMAWARLYAGTFPPLARIFHVGNGGSRHILEAVKLKKMGVLPAIPDLILLYPNKGFHAWCCEMKAKDGKPTLAQRQMQKDLCALGYDAGIYYGWEAARDGVLRYLGEE